MFLLRLIWAVVHALLAQRVSVDFFTVPTVTPLSLFLLSRNVDCDSAFTVDQAGMMFLAWTAPNRSAGTAPA